MIDLVKSLTKCTPSWNAILFLSVTFFLDFVKICVFSQGCVFLGTTEYGGRKKDGAQRLCLSFQLRSFWALRTTAELFPVLPRAGFALIVPTNKFLFFLKILFIYLFLEIEEVREKGKERNIDWLLLVCTPTKDQTSNPGRYPDPESTGNLSLCPTNSAQPTEHGWVFFLHLYHWLARLLNCRLNLKTTVYTSLSLVFWIHNLLCYFFFSFASPEGPGISPVQQALT